MVFILRYTQNKVRDTQNEIRASKIKNVTHIKCLPTRYIFLTTAYIKNKNVYFDLRTR